MIFLRRTSQLFNTNTQHRYRVALCSLIALLAAFQPAEKASSEANTPTTKPATTATASAANTIQRDEATDIGEDEAASKPRLDASYTTADLRPSYVECVNARNGNTFDLKDCGDKELAYQEQQLAAIAEPVIDSPDSAEKDKWLEEQAAWWVATKQNCAFDPTTDGQGQMLDAQSCRINRLANRVEALTSRSANP